jgi:hypothetical protein
VVPATPDAVSVTVHVSGPDCAAAGNVSTSDPVPHPTDAGTPPGSGTTPSEHAVAFAVTHRITHGPPCGDTVPHDVNDTTDGDAGGAGEVTGTGAGEATGAGAGEATGTGAGEATGGVDGDGAGDGPSETRVWRRVIAALRLAAARAAGIACPAAVRVTVQISGADVGLAGSVSTSDPVAQSTDAGTPPGSGTTCSEHAVAFAVAHRITHGPPCADTVPHDDSDTTAGAGRGGEIVLRGRECRRDGVRAMRGLAARRPRVEARRGRFAGIDTR